MAIHWWIHKDGWIYTGDETEGSREATQDEIEEHLKITSFSVGDSN
ncbi:hypothetical protein [Erwinia rhapontici]|nr:hypothetical protein [Erwinia rhapontici]MBP2156850.1 hypothetical protein [Erwinia rhapontici]